ncbi:MAG: RidA family protein [Caulobacteraceae bacterium]|nr:RidA family protein [Caulobacteraceae bacterium]
MTRTLVNPKGTEPLYENFHFSAAVRVGDTIWVSGQVGLDEKMHPAQGMTAQTRLAFEGLKRALEAAGASLADVVELTTFHIDLRGEMAEFSAVKDEYFPANYPAWTAVGVTQLAIEALRVEVRAVAVAGSAAGR